MYHKVLHNFQFWKVPPKGMEFLVNEFLESKDLWMDQLEKALCMADKLIYKTNLIPLSLWKSQNIKCRMKIP